MENEKPVMQCNNAGLADFIDPSGALREAGLVKVEATVYGVEPWADFIAARATGAILEIDEEVFYYWLEVLPPVYMNKDQNAGGKLRRCSFGFAEGAEPVTDFWLEGKRFFCQLSTRMNHC